MPQTFRIALGTGSCRTGGTNLRFQAVCDGLMRRLEALKGSSTERLRKLPEEGQPEAVANGGRVVYTIYRKMLGDGAALIVVQAFLRTLSWPTHFSFSGIGRIYADGFVLTEDGTIKDAPDELLWAFR